MAIVLNQRLLRRWAVLLVFAAAERVEAGAIFDFSTIPIVPEAQVGFRAEDRPALAVADGGAAGTRTSAQVVLDPSRDSVFLQADLRRLYLINRKTEYRAGLANAFTFWLRVPAGSPLIRQDGPNVLGLWTYHWRPGDLKVGGPSNRSLATDSMMHGYANFYLLPGCEERWIKVVLSASAFQQQRNYFHWYAAQGVTGELDFFSTLRQLQFKYLGKFEQPVGFRMDEIGFEKLPETVRVAPGFAALKAPASGGEVRIPIALKNPTQKERRYRYFLSSELGASRESMYEQMWRLDDLYAARAVQQAVGGDGGVGAAVLWADDGAEVGHSEIRVAAGGEWKGAIVHRLKPEMLGRWVRVAISGEPLARRDTLTTSAVFWDPEDPPPGGMHWVRAAPSNADDSNHPAPPGFPKQFRPPPGWRSEDIPLGQVGGYFVSEITLEP